MYAVVLTGGKQYKVTKDLMFETELLKANVGDKVRLDVLMCADGDKVLVGKDAKKVVVEAEVIAHGKNNKVTIFTYKAKKNIRKRQGHRQPFTKLKVVEIKA